MAAAQAQEKAYSADRFNIDIITEQGGSLLVTETVVFNFVGGPFTFVFRELPTEHTDGLEIVSASVDGIPYGRGENPGQVTVEAGNPLRVTWHLEATSNATRTFVLTYRAHGVVRQTNNADLLLWQALPDSYEYSIGSSRTAVHYPPTTNLTAEPRLYAGNAEIGRESGTVTFQTAALQPNTPLVIELAFAPGSLIAAPPAWQRAEMVRAEQRANQAAQLPYWAGAGLVLFGSGLVLLIGYWRRYSIKRPTGPQTLYNPPGNLKPGVAGALVAEAASPTWPNALGTLFDLADRDVLRIVERPEKHWYRQHDFDVTLVAEPSDLLPHEAALLSLLFESKKGRVGEVKLSDLGGRVTGSRWDGYKKAVEMEMKQAGFWSAAQNQVRRVYFIGGGLLLAVGLAGFLLALFLINSLGFGPLLLSGILFLLAVVAWIMGASFSPLSGLGLETAVAWKAFAQHLKNVSKGKEAVSSPDMFTQYLPYAAGFGLVEQWARQFEKSGWTELPAYFQVLPTTDAANSMALFVMMSAASSSSGGSAAGAAGAAAGGAAGGGASGAG